MGRMRRLQARTEVGFIIPLGSFALFELSLGLSITELGPSPAGELLLPIADDLVLTCAATPTAAIEEEL